RRGRLAIEDEPRDLTNLGTTDVQDGRAKIPDDRLPAPLRVSPDGHRPFPGVVQSKSAGAGADDKACIGLDSHAEWHQKDPSTSGHPTMNPSGRAVRRTSVPLASIARRAAWIRSTASLNSKRGFDASPVRSSIESPAIPVAVAAVTLTPTASGSFAKPPWKSALTGISTPWAMDRRWPRVSSTDMRLSGLPWDQANPELVVARARKPSRASRRALPRSHELGITKQPDSWSRRNTRQRSLWGVTPVSLSQVRADLPRLRGADLL